MDILNVIVSPYMTHTDGNRGYWLYGENIALNAESYKVEDDKLFEIFGLTTDKSVSILENENIICKNTGESFESMEEFLLLRYGLDNLEQETNLIISFENKIA